MDGDDARLAAHEFRWTQMRDRITELEHDTDELKEALQLCLMRFKECGAKGHDRIIYMLTRLLTKK